MNIINLIKTKILQKRNDVYKKLEYNFNLKNFLDEKFPKSKYTEILDSQYRLCDYQTAKEIVNLVPIHLFKYKKEIYDCDDFAWEYRAFMKRIFPELPIGYCHVDRINDKHALNFIIYVTKSGRLSFAFIEPQSGKLFYTNYKPYLLLV